MASKRKDGQRTRYRLLEAACEVFSDKGYEEATIAEICKGAGANVAAVNYYFTDKATLYVEAWKLAFGGFKDDILSQELIGSPEDYIRQYIKVLTNSFRSPGKSSHAGRLYLMEMIKPTGLIAESWQELIEPQRKRLQGIIRNIVGSEVDERDIKFCEMSIITQCRIIGTTNDSDLEYMFGMPVTAWSLDEFAEHIFNFTLAGLLAISAQGK